MDRNTEKYIILITFISSFFTSYIVNGIIIGVPDIATTFGMNNVLQNWIGTIYVFVSTVLTIPAGQISGKIGFKKTITIFNAVFLIGLLGASLAFSSESFLFFRVVQGIGVAFVNVCEISILTLAIDESRRGKSLGIIMTGVYLGTTLSPAISGFLVYNFGWRSMFYVSIPFIALTIILMKFRVNEEWIVNKDHEIDIKGSIIYVLGMTSFIYGFTILMNFTGQVLIIVGIILIAMFMLYETKRKHPALDMNLFKNKPFTCYNLAGLCGFFAFMITTTIFNYYFQYVKGWDPQMTGLILLISPLIMSITAPNAGRLSDKTHPHKIATTGMTITTIALVLFIFVGESTPIYFVIITMILQALGMGLFSTPNVNAVMSSVDKKDAAYASATQLTMRAVGQTMSLSLLTLVFAFIMGNLDLSSQYAHMIMQSSHIICGLCALVCFFGIIISLFGIKSDIKTKI